MLVEDGNDRCFTLDFGGSDVYTSCNDVFLYRLSGDSIALVVDKLLQLDFRWLNIALFEDVSSLISMMVLLKLHGRAQSKHTNRKKIFARSKHNLL